jgi:hypothetical protein
MEIYHDGPVKIRPNHLFLAFTTIEHLKAPQFTKYISLYHIVMTISLNSCGIIQVKRQWSRKLYQPQIRHSGSTALARMLPSSGVQMEAQLVIPKLSDSNWTAKKSTLACIQ